jgi:hypothetical protein
VRVGYLVQSHKNMAQLERLASVLTTADETCRVHFCHDGRNEGDVSRLEAMPRVTVSLVEGGRGGYHNIGTWLSGVEALGEGDGVDYVVTLSGQDYPVRPLEPMKQALELSGDGFLEAFPALTHHSNWPIREGRSRYLYRWRRVRPMTPSTRRRLHWIQALNRIQPLVRVNVSYDALWFATRSGGPPADLECYGGSMFTSLSWRAVDHIRHTLQTRPDVVAWARESLVVEESLFQTILMNADQFTFDPTSRRFYKFDHVTPGSPAFLTAADIPDAVRSGCYFARKFDMAQHPDALDAADEAARSKTTDRGS